MKSAGPSPGLMEPLPLFTGPECWRSIGEVVQSLLLRWWVALLIQGKGYGLRVPLLPIRP